MFDVQICLQLIALCVFTVRQGLCSFLHHSDVPLRLVAMLLTLLGNASEY